MGRRQTLEQPDARTAGLGAGRRRRGQQEPAGESDRARASIAGEAESDRCESRHRRRQIRLHRDRRSLSRQARQGARAARREDQEPDPGDQLGLLRGSSRRRPGPIRRVLSFWRWGKRLVSSSTPGVMGPGVRRDDGETMTIADKLVLQRQHHLKWRAFDRLELILMMLCGLLCFGFSLSVMSDIVTRTIGHPWLWLQEVTSTLFIYAIFIGAAVPTRRNDHLYLTAISEALHGTPRLIVEIIIRLVVLGVAFCLIWFGYINFLRGFGSFRLPSGTPIASLYAAIPLAGVLIALFTIEQLVNGVTKGFDHPEPPEEDFPIPPVDTSIKTKVGL